MEYLVVPDINNKNMKTKVLVVLLLITLLRWVNYAMLHADPVFYLSARNFNGRGMLVIPSWLDILIPLLVIVLLNKAKGPRVSARNIALKSIAWALAVLHSAMVMRYLLSNYIYEDYVFVSFDKSLIVKYLLFVLTYWAIQVWADSLTNFRRGLRWLLLVWGVLVLSISQDMFASAWQSFQILGLFNSVGLSALLISWALRPYYKQNPWASLAGAAVAGVLVVFPVMAAQSNSFFTLFFPFLAMVAMAWLARRNRIGVGQLLVAIIPFLLALFVNYGLPSILPEQLARTIIEKPEPSTRIRENYHGISIEYPDPQMADVVRGLADVIRSANRVSQEVFGISPQVNELIITGIGPGGFHAEFPHRIVGKIIDTLYLKHCMDSLFLNNPNLRADFPDPVNAILHEYSHLYGVFPYHRWLPGPEEEGWATYAATRLAKLIYKRNPNLWNPAYNFGQQAEKITQLNLNGKAVAWSHSNEFGGFILWYQIGKSMGEENLFRTRWEITAHDMDKGLAYYYSNPTIAQKAVKTFGKEFFERYGRYKPVKYGDIYTGDELIYMARTCGLDTAMARKMYDYQKNRLIDPSVPVP